jgi:hypothetical protein
MTNRRNVGRDEVVPLSKDDGWIASSDDRALSEERSVTVSTSISIKIKIIMNFLSMLWLRGKVLIMHKIGD